MRAAKQRPFEDEEVFLEWVGRKQGRTPAVAVLLDSRGRQMTSEAFAAWLGARRDEGAQHIVFAIGPAEWMVRCGSSSGRNCCSRWGP